MSAYQILVKGHPLPGFEAEAVVRSLATLARLPEPTAAMLLAGRPVVVKSGIDQVTAERYVGRLRAIGVDASADLEPVLQLDDDLARRLSNSPTRTIAASEIHGDAAAASSPQLEDLYRAAVGPRNTAYYLTKFARMDARGGADVLWNWPAFFLTSTWALYRKLYGAFFVLVAWSTLCAVVGKAGAPWWAIGLEVASMPIFGAYANAAYHSKVRRMIGDVSANLNGQNHTVVTRYLERKGGVHRWVYWLAVCFWFVVALGVVASIIVPALRPGPSAIVRPTVGTPPPKDSTAQGFVDPLASKQADLTQQFADPLAPKTSGRDRRQWDESNIIGMWRCVTFSSGSLGFWAYVGDGKLWYHGDRSIGTPITSETVPTNWSIQGPSLVWHFESKGPDWVAENVIQELSRDRLKYRDSAGHDVACTRLMY